MSVNHSREGSDSANSITTSCTGTNNNLNNKLLYRLIACKKPKSFLAVIYTSEPKVSSSKAYKLNLPVSSQSPVCNYIPRSVFDITFAFRSRNSFLPNSGQTRQWVIIFHWLNEWFDHLQCVYSSLIVHFKHILVFGVILLLKLFFRSYSKSSYFVWSFSWCFIWQTLRRGSLQVCAVQARLSIFFLLTGK